MAVEARLFEIMAMWRVNCIPDAHETTRWRWISGFTLRGHFRNSYRYQMIQNTLIKLPRIIKL